MIVEPSDDAVEPRRYKLGWAPHGIHKDEDLRGFLFGEAFEDLGFARKILQLSRRGPKALRTVQDDGQAFGDKVQTLWLGQLTEPLGLMQSDVGAPCFLVTQDVVRSVNNGNSGVIPTNRPYTTDNACILI